MKLLIHYIKIHPTLNSLYGNEMGKMPYKVAITNLGENRPKFEDLSNCIRAARNYVDKVDYNLSVLVGENGFSVSQKLKENIRNKYTFKTNNIEENIALILFQKFSKLLSLANQLGADIYPKDLHPEFRDCLKTKNIRPNYPYLKLTNTGNNENIREISVASNFNKNDISRILKGLKNLNEADLQQIKNKIKNI